MTEDVKKMMTITKTMVFFTLMPNISISTSVAQTVLLFSYSNKKELIYLS